MKKIAILGSTGSIGTQALDIIRNNRELFRVQAIAAHSNIDLIEQQISEFEPRLAVISDSSAYSKLVARYSGRTRLVCGAEGLLEAASMPGVDTVLTAMVGFAGLRPTLAAIDAGKRIALANKETLVAAGKIVMQRAADKGVDVIPVDSEHSAIFQCLNGERRSEVRRLILTASGGPFFGQSAADLQRVELKDALKHPNWDMGAKITIDSASLANKGLEVIEAGWLFGISLDCVDVVVHRQSIVHSMVEYVDNSIIAQMGVPDMRLPIQYAFTYPDRTRAHYPRTDLLSVPQLSFEQPDRKTFRCLDLAYRAGTAGGLYPCAFNAANEVAVAEFMNNRIKFVDIPTVIQAALEQDWSTDDSDLDAVFATDGAVRQFAMRFIAERNQ